MIRVVNWPAGISPPRRVRIYFRNGAFLLQWWERAQRKNVAERVRGDLIEAVCRARELEGRLTDVKSSGRGAAPRSMDHSDLVARFVDDLRRRCDAGEIEYTTVRRYSDALAHYLAFAALPEIKRRFPRALDAGREFALAFGAFLEAREVTKNGRARGASRLMRDPTFVWDAARTLYRWAIAPDRGGLLPENFRTPFHRAPRRPGQSQSLLEQPDITREMAAGFFDACDDYQLRLFVPLLYCGLRAAEPAFLFHEHVEGAPGNQWLKVACNRALHYTTKGKLDKLVPLTDSVARLLGADGRHRGPLYQRRVLTAVDDSSSLHAGSLSELEDELARRLRGVKGPAQERRRQRDRLLREAGGITYDHIQAEFGALAEKLRWPPRATLKDFRHLFLTTLSNAGLAEPYRQYLAGQAQSTAAVTRYTHLDQVRHQYDKAVGEQWEAIQKVLERRLAARSINNPSES